MIIIIRKISILCLLFALGMLFFVTGCEKNTFDSQNIKKIEIINLVTHPSLTEAIEGFKNGIAGSEKLTNVAISYTLSNAEGKQSQVPLLAQEAIARTPDLIFALSTPAASMSVKYTQPAGIPLVYAAVTDPVAAKIVTSMDHSNTLASGVSDRYPVEEQIKLIKLIQPGIKRLGVYRSSGEENSEILAKWTIEEAEDKEIAPTEYVLGQDQDITLIAEQAFSENDAVIVNGDNKLVENLQAILNVALDKKKPLYSGDPDSVKSGAVAAVGPSYYEMGVRAGEIAASVLAGDDIRTISSEYPKSFDYIVNTKAAALMGLSLSDGLWGYRSIWTSRSGDVR